MWHQQLMQMCIWSYYVHCRWKLHLHEVTIEAAMTLRRQRLQETTGSQTGPIQHFLLVWLQWIICRINQYNKAKSWKCCLYQLPPRPLKTCTWQWQPTEHIYDLPWAEALMCCETVTYSINSLQQTWLQHMFLYNADTDLWRLFGFLSSKSICIQHAPFTTDVHLSNYQCLL